MPATSLFQYVTLTSWSLYVFCEKLQLVSMFVMLISENVLSIL